jgi:fucose permease
VGHGFAVFYTGVIGSGALAPILLGVIGDYAGRTLGVIAAASMALATIPVVLAMQRCGRDRTQDVS